jgi:P-type Cu2+ transporter
MSNIAKYSLDENCLHCNLPVSNSEEFCCNGCKIAYKTIHKLGFANYYQNRILSDKEISLKPDETANNQDSDVSDFVYSEQNNDLSIHLLVKGLHCGACVWLIENILRKQPDIKLARINMSTKRLHLSWSGQNKSYANKLINLINKLGYHLVPYDVDILADEDRKYNTDLIKALSIAGFGAGNVMLISIALWSSGQDKMGIFTHNFLYWISAIISIPVILYSGRIFFRSALRSIKARSSNMDIPISVAIIITTIVSIIEIFQKGQHAYFDSAVMLIFFLLIGRYLDFITRRKALNVSQDFALLNATSAVIIDENGKHKVILAKNIKKDMILSIAAGDKIAADGVIISGASEIDNSIITGESQLKSIEVGDQVNAGAINFTNSITVKVTISQQDSLISKISKLVQDLEFNKGKFVRIADKISRYYTPIVHLLALITIFGWYYVFDLNFKAALLNGVAVLIITCPCALALAVPIVSIIANSRLLKQGIVVKSGEILEKLNKIDTVIFDKTGTLTLGKPTLEDAIIIENGKEKKLSRSNELFQFAASMSVKSNHPLSKALYQNFSGKIMDINIKELAGSGLIAKINNKEIKLGKKEFVLDKKEQKLIKPNKNPQIFLKFHNKIAIFTFSDLLKSDTRGVINYFQQNNKRIILLSGDKKEVVSDIANQVGIEEYYHSCNPIQKAKIITDLKAQNHNILMCGDGINDAPPLIASDAAISFAKASDITKNIAEIIIQGEKLSPLIQIHQTSLKYNKIIRENFAISFLYNIVAVPFAVMGYVTPLIAALSMSFSSIIVTLNSLKLCKKKANSR